MLTQVPETIPELLRAAHDASSAKPWLRYEAATWSLDDVVEKVDAMARGLAERGVTHGDRVAILVGNRPDTIFAWFAANQLGAIAAPLNPAYKPAELAGVLTLIDPRVIVAADDLRELALSHEPTPSRVVSPAELLSSASPPAPRAFSSARAETAESFEARPPRAVVKPDDVAVLLATSGTTGAPKAVMQTHRTYALTAEAFPSWVDVKKDDTLLCTLPLFHINAQAYSIMGALFSGASLALVPKFSLSRFWDTVRELHATCVNVVGAMIHILLSTPPSSRDRDHTLRIVYSALALPEARHREFEDRFGVKMIVGYGLSETTFGTVWNVKSTEPPPYGTMGSLRQHPRFPALNRARVVRDDGSDAGDNETGEMWLSNPAMMRGYFGDEAQTRAAFDFDGEDRAWFKTGDLVKRDSRALYTFVSRKKDVLRRRGENVAAAEIENALTSHQAVHEAAVVGFPSPLGEDDIVAFVVAKAGAAVDPEALREHVKQLLADYKVPTRIHIMASLPRTATERIAKHLLREPP